MKNKKAKNRKKRMDNLLSQLFSILMVLTSVLGLLMLSDYIGHVPYDDAKAGTITEIQINRERDADYWNGVYGLAIQFPAINNSYIIQAEAAGMDPVTMLVQCLEPGSDHEVYALTVDPLTINWDSVTAATTAFVDNFIGADPINDPMSATNTFTDTMTISLGNRSISNIPMAHTYQRDDHNSDKYMHGLLTDGINIIVVSKMTTDYPMGFDGNYYNYQMFVPVPINMTQTYYLITDPYDVCPEGADEAFGKGTVEGWVTDADTGIFLENAEVFIGTDYDFSDADGYYNLSTTRGTYKVFAFKTGYNNYVGNVTVIEGVVVEHNISMTLYEEITGTGSGVGTGVGPGISDKTKSKSNDDIGPSFGPGIGPFLEKPENPGIDHFVSLEKLQKKLRLGNFFVETIMIYNFRKEAAQLTFKIIGNATQIMEMDKTSLVIE
ncbi:MAG: hypothetical protein KKF44_00570, partial [Nanoarchaeota archaeon]|nr:hypothetical protein [Nanoarchaeota archaeon]